MKLLKVALTIIAIAIVVIIPSKSACAIRIGLYTEAEEAFVGVSQTGFVADAASGNKIMLLSPMMGYKVYKKGKYIIFNNKKDNYKVYANSLIIRSNEDKGYVFTKNKWYKGNLIILNCDKGLTIINEVDLENYIMGVVPAEMPPAWNFEAHKAQAIAARSYAVANKGKRSKYGYDLKDTPVDQAYSGLSGETKQTNQAVLATKGEVLIYNNKIIPAYYHASAGGKTLLAKQVWGNNLPYLKSVNSFDEHIPKHGHGVGMSQNGANMLASKGYNAYQILGYFYNNVKLRRLY